MLIGLIQSGWGQILELAVRCTPQPPWLHPSGEQVPKNGGVATTKLTASLSEVDLGPPTYFWVSVSPCKEARLALAFADALM